MSGNPDDDTGNIAFDANHTPAVLMSRPATAEHTPRGPAPQRVTKL
jgi:hypothetical protein